MQTHTGRSIAGGFVGTLVMTGMMYMVAPMMGVRMDIAQMLGSMLGNNWTAGMMVHFVNGTIIFPLIYAHALYQWLPGTPAVRGATLGVALWLLAQVMVMPMMGGGFFSTAMGGMSAAMGSLIGHVLYGGTLGAIAGAPEVTRAATA